MIWFAWCRTRTTDTSYAILQLYNTATCVSNYTNFELNYKFIDYIHLRNTYNSRESFRLLVNNSVVALADEGYRLIRSKGNFEVSTMRLWSNERSPGCREFDARLSRRNATRRDANPRGITTARKSRLFRPFDVVSRSRCPYFSRRYVDRQSGSEMSRARGDNHAKLHDASWNDFSASISPCHVKASRPIWFFSRMESFIDRTSLQTCANCRVTRSSVCLTEFKR